MSARRATWLAWSLCAAAAAVLVFAYVLPAFGASPRSDRLFESIFTLMILAYAAVGAVVASRRPHNPVGWVFCAFGLCAAVLAAAAEYAELDPVGRSAALPEFAIGSWLAEWISLPTFGLVVFVLLLFPTGRPLSPRWRGAGWFTAVALAGGALSAAFKPGILGENSRPAENPLGIEGLVGDALTTMGPVFEGLSVASIGLGVVAMVLRFRRSRGDERLQLKWLALTGGLGGAGLTANLVADGVGIDLEPLFYLSTLAFAVLPMAAAVAILRHRLYDIDVVIRRTVVYGALTLTLLASYLGLVLVLQQILDPESDFAVAGSTLAVAALVRPARARIQEIVDRRFYRSRYDAAHTIETFGARLRDEVELDSLSRELRDVVRETMQPAHASLWLRRSS